MMNAAEARAYLKAVETLPAQWAGPLRMFYRTEDGAPLLAPSRALVASVVQTAPGRFAAPSPWHAATWLLDLATLAAQMAEVDGESGLRSPLNPLYGAPVFRGQRDPRWRLRSTLLRLPPAAQEKEARAFGIVVFALLKIFGYGEGFEYNTPSAHLAALQHHGAPTPLLDFSLDPRIATVFACSGAAAQETASVFFSQIGVIAETGALVLPPPWIKRLYDQRGVFGFCAEDASADFLDRSCLRIDFPADPAFIADYPQVFQSAVEPWYGRAMEWARAQVAAGISDDAATDPDLNALLAACGEIPFKWNALQPAAMAEAPRNFTDMLQWLALKVVNGQFTYDTTAIELLARENQGYLRSQRVVFRFFRNQFRDLSLAEMLRDPMLAALYAVSTYLDDSEAGRV